MRRPNGLSALLTILVLLPGMSLLVAEDSQVPPAGETELDKRASEGEPAPVEVTRISGWTFGTEGRLAGVRVVAAAVSTPEGLTTGEPAFSTAISDAEGYFQFDIPGVAPFAVYAAADGLAPTAIKDHDPADGELELRLILGHPLSGTVTDRKSGRPIADVQVLARVESARPIADAGGAELVDLVATSGDDGAYSFGHLACGKFFVRTRASGWSAELSEHVISADNPASNAIHFTLRQGTQLGGRVLDDKGLPLSQASVEVFPRSFEQRIQDLRTWVGADPESTSTRTDDVGRFEFSGIPLLEDYALVASADGYANASVAPVAPETDDLEIQLFRGGGVSFALVDGEDNPYVGALVARARPADESVSVFLRGNHGLNADAANDQGRYLISNIPPGEYILSISPPGFVPWTEPLVVAEGDLTDLGDLPLPWNNRLEGRVVDDLDQPLGGAKITVSPKARALPDAAALETDDQGRFSIRGIDSTIRIHARAEGHREESVRIGDPAAPLKLVLARQGSLRGQVERMDLGRPADFFRVAARRQDEEKSSTRRFGRFRPGDPSEREFVGSDGGNFRLDELLPGTYTVTIESPSCLPARLTPVEILSGQVTDLGQVPLAAGISLDGRVVSRKTGSPVVGAILTRQRSAGPLPVLGMDQLSDAKSGPDGSFRLEGLPAGPHRLQILHENYAPSHLEIDIRPGELQGPLLVELGPGGAVEGTAVDGAGTLLPGAFVMLTDGSGVAIGKLRSADEQGRFRLENLAPGNYMLLWFSMEPGGAPSGEPPQMHTVTIEEGRTTTLPGATGTADSLTVRGIVVRGDEPVSNASLRWTPTDGTVTSPREESTTGADGGFEVRLSGAGDYTVSIVEEVSPEQPRQRRLLSRLRISVDGTNANRLEIQVPESGISGSVRLAQTGEPPEGAAILPLTPDEAGRIHDVARDASYKDGVFSIEGLPAGEYYLLISASGMAAQLLGPLELSDGETIDDIDVLLEPSHPLALELRTEGGEPIEAARVVPLGQAELGWAYSLLRETTDADGKARHDRLPDGLWDLAVIGGAGALTIVEDVEVGPDGGELLTLTPERAARLALTAISADKRPIGGARLKIKIKGGRDLTPLLRRGLSSLRTQLSLVSGANGRIELDQLSAGAYEVEVFTPDGRSARTNIRLTAGELLEESLILR